MNGNKAITSRDVDFAKWYTDIVRAAKLADYTSVKGCIAIEAIGAFSISLLTHAGIGFLLASLEIVASFGVIRKIPRQDIIVANSANISRPMHAPIVRKTLIACGNVGSEYTLLITSVNIPLI